MSLQCKHPASSWSEPSSSYSRHLLWSLLTQKLRLKPANVLTNSVLHSSEAASVFLREVRVPNPRLEKMTRSRRRPRSSRLLSRTSSRPQMSGTRSALTSSGLHSLEAAFVFLREAPVPNPGRRRTETMDASGFSTSGGTAASAGQVAKQFLALRNWKIWHGRILLFWSAACIFNFSGLNKLS